jgi:tungstate transport system permease protein
VHQLSDGISAALMLIGSLDPELFAIIALSLSVSLTATIIAFLIGTPLGATLAVRRFPGHTAAVVLANALLGLPPVVVGLIVYLTLSRAGPLGAYGLLFTPTAMIIAQTLLATPIVVALVHRSLVPLWREFGDSFRIAGASRNRTAFQLCRMAQAALVTTFLAAFGRAIAEVGAILIVGGNIRGFTRTMTTTIALETSKGELGLALGLGLILITLSVGVSAVAFTLDRFSRRR